jgi:hypothetical protein
MTRTRPRTDGSLALELDFGPSTRPLRGLAQGGRTVPLRLARRSGPPDKYKVLAHRRRQAQITARRLLDLMWEQNGAGRLRPRDDAGVAACSGPRPGKQEA